MPVSQFPDETKRPFLRMKHTKEDEKISRSSLIKVMSEDEAGFWDNVGDYLPIGLIFEIKADLDDSDSGESCCSSDSSYWSSEYAFGSNGEFWAKPAQVLSCNNINKASHCNEVNDHQATGKFDEGY